MKVSVVVPCFDHERYVGRCLAAIDEQDHDDLEVIVVDDGSRDDSWRIISSHPWRRGRAVRALRTENRGAHAAINRGLALATGDWIAICNSDDYFAPHRVSTLLRRAAATSARFAFSGVRFVDERDADVGERLDYARDILAKQRAIATHPSVGFALVLSNVAVSTGNFFFERSLVADVGYFRPYRYVHDWDFVLRALLFTEPLFVPEALYAYRIHPRNSFAGLQGVAAFECPELMRRFMKATVTGRFPNRLAPSPRNWPGYFDVFIEKHWYQPYLTEWDEVDGVVYRPPADETRAA